LFGRWALPGPGKEDYSAPTYSFTGRSLWSCQKGERRMQCEGEQKRERKGKIVKKRGGKG